MEFSKAGERILRRTQIAATSTRPVFRISSTSRFPSRPSQSRRHFSLQICKYQQIPASGPPPGNDPPAPNPVVSNLLRSGRSSADDVRHAFKLWKTDNQPPAPRQSPQPFGTPRPNGRIFDFSRMRQPAPTTSNNQTAEMDRMFPSRPGAIPLPPSAESSLDFGFGRWPSRSSKSGAEQWMEDMKHLDTNLRLSPKTGRTVQVNPAAPYDLALKLRRLGKLVQNDQIRKMERRGAFHERGGLKRKRLKMERWRVRFGDAFRSIIKRVRQLAKKGW